MRERERERESNSIASCSSSTLLRTCRCSELSTFSFCQWAPVLLLLSFNGMLHQHIDWRAKKQKKEKLPAWRFPLPPSASSPLSQGDTRWNCKLQTAISTHQILQTAIYSCTCCVVFTRESIRETNLLDGKSYSRTRFNQSLCLSKWRLWKWKWKCTLKEEEKNNIHTRT